MYIKKWKTTIDSIVNECTISISRTTLKISNVQYTYIYIYGEKKENHVFGERIELTITCDRSTVGTVPSMMSEESRKQPNEHEATGGSF